MFSSEIIEIAEKSGKSERLKQIEYFIKEHEQFYIYKTDLSEELIGCKEPKKLFGYNAIRFIQLLLYRSKMLMIGSVKSLNSKTLLSSILSVRAHYETTGSIVFFRKRLSSYYNGNIEFDKLDDDLLRLSLGATTINLPEVPKPIQVLNLIDATDEYLKKNIFKDKMPDAKMFRSLYEDLCDFCHPNYQGTFSGHEIIGDGSVIFHDIDHIADAEFSFFFNLTISAALFLYFYEEVLLLLKEKEIMPVFHKSPALTS